MKQAPGCTAKAHCLPGFHAERLHDAVAGDGLVQDVLNVGQLVLTPPGCVANAPADPPRRINNEWDKQNEYPGQSSTQQDDYTGGEDESR